MGLTIRNQPESGKILAAYQQILINAEITANIFPPITPVVYCDIYINDTFYRTLSKSFYNSKTSLVANYIFDIKRPLQDYLKQIYPSFAGSTVVLSDITSVYVKIRLSFYNSDNLLVQDDPIPIQATDTTIAVAGAGYESNHFYVVNAKLKFTDNQDFATHTTYFRPSGWVIGSYPLTHRGQDYEVTLNDSDYYPIISIGDIYIFQLIAMDVAGTLIYNNSIANSISSNNKIALIPSGPSNINSLFINSGPGGVNFSLIGSYYLNIKDANGTLIARTCTYNIIKECDNTITLYFVNTLGQYDMLKFLQLNSITNVKAKEYEKPLPFGFNTLDAGLQRTNIEMLETISLTREIYDTFTTNLCKELLQSPRVFMLSMAEQGSSNYLQQVIISDAKYVDFNLAKAFKSTITFEIKNANQQVNSIC